MAGSEHDLLRQATQAMMARYDYKNFDFAIPQHCRHNLHTMGGFKSESFFLQMYNNIYFWLAQRIKGMWTNAFYSLPPFHLFSTPLSFSSKLSFPHAESLKRQS